MKLTVKNLLHTATGIIGFVPILRPLSDINKDEVAGLIGIQGFVVKGNFCAPFFQIQYQDLNGEDTYRHAYITQLSPDQFKKLLDWHFDLFGLIESGLAIERNSITTPSQK